MVIEVGRLENRILRGALKGNKGCMGNSELSRLSLTAIGSNGWIRKSLRNELKLERKLI